MALAEHTKIEPSIEVIQSNALELASEFNHPKTPESNLAGIRQELDGSLAIIQEHLETTQDDLVIDLSHVGRPAERVKQLMDNYPMDEDRWLIIPRNFITSITLNGLWGGPRDCSPSADIRVVIESQDEDIQIYGQDPIPSPGKWSRFRLGQLKL